MNIFLCGFMGSGKSTFLDKLSQNGEGYKFLDMDAEILNAFGKGQFSNLGELIEKSGWAFFRMKECELIADYVADNKTNKVIALGGGAVCNDQNLKLILETEENALVYLETPFDLCWERIKDQTHRPLVQKGRNHLQELYSERLSQYQQAGLSLDNDAQGDVARPSDLVGMLQKS